MIIGIFVALSVATKCLTILHFLAPCLGLYHLLRHFQGEARPFASGVGYKSDYQVHLPNVDVSHGMMHVSQGMMQVSHSLSPVSQELRNSYIFRKE